MINIHPLVQSLRIPGNKFSEARNGAYDENAPRFDSSGQVFFVDLIRP